MKRSLFLSILTLLTCFALHAEPIISISGRVVDSKNKALPKVNIHVVGSPIATVTNGDGEFSLKLPSSAINSVVKFSYMGYSSEELSVEELEFLQGEAVIKLREELLAIDAVNIDLKSATTYIEEVLRRRFENYPKGKNYQTAFYREVIKKRNSFATLTEAVVEIEKSGMQSIYSDRAAIYRGRSFRDRRFTDTLFVKLQGGIVSALLLDVAKKHDIVFTDNPREEYNFWFDKSVTIDGRRMRVVNFSQKRENPELMLYKGALFIDSLTMAIARAEFALNMEEYKDSSSNFVKKRPSGTEVKMLGAKYIVAYRLLDEKWHFDYCNTELNFRCHSKKRVFRNSYTITSEMVVTNHQPEPKKIPYSSSVRFKDLLFDSAKDFYDENFWEHYNIIEHEHSIDTELKRFLRQLKEK